MVGFILAALLVGSQTGVEMGKLSTACAPGYVDSDAAGTGGNSTDTLTKGECVAHCNEQGPACSWDCSNQDQFPLVVSATDATDAEDITSISDLAGTLGSQIADAGSTLSSFYDITEDVGTCNAERMILNIGLLSYFGICIALAVYFGRLQKNFRHRAGDLIEAALIQSGPVDLLLKEALDSSPDIARAAVLKMSAMIASASQEYTFDDEEERPVKKQIYYI